MLFKETENQSLPTIILLHGGGLSWWSLQPIIELLKEIYHVVTPIIDGHGEDAHETFISIEDSAKKLINYIDTNHNGKVYAIGGLSIGAQIVTEVLSSREDIADFAIIESSLVYPIKGTSSMTIPAYKIFYGLIKLRWFSKLQAKTLCVPENMFEQYYTESIVMSKQSLINITLSNGNYELKSIISNTKAKVLILVGGKEIGIMRKSAKRLNMSIAGSELVVLPGMGHGEISLMYPEKYVELVITFLKK
ncbi:MAG: alpha/beta fold family hydrolase [Herbinix sp.]|jgi:pimeloyl-ACP methyl ester carboxylesterase|nr:alpha/beta fold family hydrolase [Herbinix sp.]